MHKTSLVRLTDDERPARVQLPQSGTAAASTRQHAPRVLHVDANGPTCADAQVATAWHGPGHTGRHGRPRWVAQGLAAALGRTQQAQPARPGLLAGAKAARVLAWRCGPPPPGPAQWTFPWLADQRVALPGGATLS